VSIHILFCDWKFAIGWSYEERLLNRFIYVIPALRDTMLMMFKSKNLREKIVAIDSSGDKTTDLFESFMKDKEFAKFSSFVVDALSDQFMDELNKDFVKLKVQKHS
jgi:hypothetical protein